MSKTSEIRNHGFTLFCAFGWALNNAPEVTYAYCHRPKVALSNGERGVLSADLEGPRLEPGSTASLSASRAKPAP